MIATRLQIEKHRLSILAADPRDWSSLKGFGEIGRRWLTAHGRLKTPLDGFRCDIVQGRGIINEQGREKTC